MPVRCHLAKTLSLQAVVLFACLAVTAVARGHEPAAAGLSDQPVERSVEKEVVIRGAACESSHGDAALDLPAYRGKLEAYYYSGDYTDDVAAVIAEARAYLQHRLQEGVDKPAIVLDVDETSLSNWVQMKKLQFGFDRERWHAWVETADAYALGPTLELATWAHDHGVAIFFITGRGEDERAATERNLAKVGYQWTTLYLEDESECCSGDSCSYAATCKSFYRKQIHDAGYTVVASLGDQRSDLLGGWSERTYKLPNPFYFVP